MKKRNITMVVAHAKNRTIGDGEKMLWHIPKDFQWFKEKTMGHPCVMGRKTMQDIVSYTKGKPLPGRQNIILSRTPQDIEGFMFVPSIEKILDMSEKQEIMIIGGATVYEQFIPYANKLIITEIDANFEGNAKFPEFDKNDFTITFKESNSENGYDFSFVIYEKP